MNKTGREVIGHLPQESALMPGILTSTKRAMLGETGTHRLKIVISF